MTEKRSANFRLAVNASSVIPEGVAIESLDFAFMAGGL
jgi:hypothetical protein